MPMPYPTRQDVLEFDGGGVELQDASPSPSESPSASPSEGPRTIGDVIFRGDTDFRLWNNLDSSMSFAIIDYKGSFSAYGDSDQQLLITDLDLVNTEDDESYVEYVTVKSSIRTGSGEDINALDATNIDDGGNTGWKFVHVLVVDDGIFTHSSDLVILSTVSELEIRESVHEHTSDEISLSSLVTLSIDESDHGHTSDQIHLSSGSTLGIPASVHGHASTEISLTTESTLAVHESVHGHASDEIGLIVNLSISDSTYQHYSDLIVLDANNLLISTSTHGHASETIGLTSFISLDISDSAHSHTSDEITLEVEAVDLAVDESEHQHASDQISLITTSDLEIGDSVHGQISDVVGLAVVLNVLSSTHQHTSDEVILNTAVNLVIDESIHGHSSDNIDFPLILVIDESAQNHTSNVLILSLFRTLESVHTHASDNIDLSTIVTLNIRDSSHRHTSPKLALQATQPVPPPDVLVFRDLQIVDRRVWQPPGYPIRKYIIWDGITDGMLLKLNAGSGFETGSHFGAQHFLRSRGVGGDAWYGGATPSDSLGPMYLQHTPTTARVKAYYRPQYDLDPIKTIEEKIGTDLPPVRSASKKRRKLRRQTQ